MTAAAAASAATRYGKAPACPASVNGGILEAYDPDRPGGQGGDTDYRTGRDQNRTTRREGSAVEAAVVFLSAAAGPGARAAPYGAARVASALKADPRLSGKLGVRIVEAGPGETPAELARRAAAGFGDLGASSGAVRVAGLSLYSWNAARLLAAAEALKAAAPSTLVVAGGPVASAEPERVLEYREGRAVDLAVAGEGEAAMADIVAALMAGEAPGGPVIRRAFADPKALPSPWLDGTLDPGRWGGAAIELTRGCPYRCAFCYESKGEGRLRRFPLETVAAELELFRKSGVEEVFVLDPTFNADPRRMAEALKIFRDRGRGLRFVVELRAETLDRSQASLLSSIDCSVQLGLQSSDPAVLALVDRKLDPDAFARKTALLDREGVVWGLDLIYGLPGDSLAGFRRSLDYALGLGPNHIDVFRLAVLPGTALRDRAAALGVDYDDEPPYLVRSIPTFGAADLAEAERLADAADLLYNRGRAVSWFGAVARLAKARPSGLIAGFDRFVEASGRPPAGLGQRAVEDLAASFVESLFDPAAARRGAYAHGSAGNKPFGTAAGAGKTPRPGASGAGGPTRLELAAMAAIDLIRVSGAWTRALADGEATEFELAWDPEELLDYAGAGLPAFVAAAERRSGRWTCAPGPDGPSFRRVAARKIRGEPLGPS